MSNAEKERIIERFEEAYFRANGHTISVVATGSGWYKTERVGSYSANRHRIAELDRMAEGLEERAKKAEVSAKRTGFIVKIAPPRLERYRHMTTRYLTDSGEWTPDRTSSTVNVFDNSRAADEIAHEFNTGLPFDYAEIEPF